MISINICITSQTAVFKLVLWNVFAQHNHTHTLQTNRANTEAGRLKLIDLIPAIGTIKKLSKYFLDIQYLNIPSLNPL